jgi:hypothetical protein
MRGCMAVVSQHQCLCGAGPMLRGRWFCFNILLPSFFVLLLLSGFAGRDWMFAAVSRWVAGGPYGVRQGELPWGPKVPREGPAQEALHTPW